MADELKDLVKALREQAGMTQADLAALIGKTDGAVAHWETGKRGMSLETAGDLADSMKLSPADRRRLIAAAQERRRKAVQTTSGRLTELETAVEELRALVEDLARQPPVGPDARS